MPALPVVPALPDVPALPAVPALPVLPVVCPAAPPLLLALPPLLELPLLPLLPLEEGMDEGLGMELDGMLELEAACCSRQPLRLNARPAPHNKRSALGVNNDRGELGMVASVNEAVKLKTSRTLVGLPSAQAKVPRYAERGRLRVHRRPASAYRRPAGRSAAARRGGRRRLPAHVQ